LADHAASGADVTRSGDRFVRRVVQTLAVTDNQSAGASLGRMVHSSRVKILPKMHTPQSGLTLRSLSHNLALFESGEMRPNWWFLPYSKESWQGARLARPLGPLAIAPTDLQFPADA